MVLSKDGVFYRQDESKAMDAGVFFIISGEVGLHTKKGGVFGKALSENTLGEECL